MEIMKIGRVELTKEEAEACYAEKLYIVTYSKIYQVMYSVAQQKYYGHVIYSNNGGMTRRGRFYKFTGAEVNHFLGYNLVNT